MSYQRWSKPGRFYVWMGSEGLNIWPPGVVDAKNGVLVANNVAGRDNAAAILRGCVDILTAEGMSVTVRKGKVSIEKL